MRARPRRRLESERSAQMLELVWVFWIARKESAATRSAGVIVGLVELAGVAYGVAWGREHAASARRSVSELKRMDASGGVFCARSPRVAPTRCHSEQTLQAKSTNDNTPPTRHPSTMLRRLPQRSAATRRASNSLANAARFTTSAR